MLEPDFLELLTRQCGREVRAAGQSNVAELQCPMGLYRSMLAQPHCACKYPTYGRKMLPYEWRSHLQATHPEDCKALLNLVEDLENEALKLWNSQPEAERVYVQASHLVQAAFPERKTKGVPGSEPPDFSPEAEGYEGGNNAQASPPVPAVHPEQEAEGVAGSKPSDQTSGMEEVEGGKRVGASSPSPAVHPEQKAEDVSGSKPTNPTPGTEGCEEVTNPMPQAVQHLLSPSLSCPFVCGIEHLVPGADYAMHCLSHLAELQTVAAVLDTLVLRAYIQQSCPFKNFAAQGKPGPCRLLRKGEDWWAHVHSTHLTDALATSMHLFRRGERTLEAAAAAAAKASGSFQLHCPIPRCISHTPTAVKLVAHFVGHLRPLHPDNDTAHLLLTRAKDMRDAGRAGAAAARQPFLAASGMGPKNGKHKSVHKGLPGKHEQHVCYTVVRGNEGVKPFYLKHQARGQQQHIDPQQQQQQQEQLTLQQQQKQSKPHPAPPKPKQAAPISSLPMYCPFPHCCTAPVATSGLEQPIHSIQLPTASNLERQTHEFETPSDLEAHAFSAHSAELLLAAHQIACTARTEGRTGMLVCPVRSVAAPPGRRPRTAVPQGLSKPTAQRHLSHHHSARGSQRAAVSEQAQGGPDDELQDHQELHIHAKDLVQHVHAQHAPLAMVVAALSKGLVRLAAANRGQPEKERCPLCPPSAAAMHLHDEAPVFGHLLDRHPTQLLKVFHCLLVLASGRDLSSAAAGQCLLQCGASKLGGGTLGAMLHAAEEHAQQLIELSAGAAAQALPNDTKAAAFSPRKGSPCKQALSPGPQLPFRLLSNANGAAAKAPCLSPAEQLTTRDSGIQAARVPAQALAREYLSRAYGPPNKRPKEKADTGMMAKPDTKTAEVAACPDMKSAEVMAIPDTTPAAGPSTKSVEVMASPDALSADMMAGAWSVPGASNSGRLTTLVNANEASIPATTTRDLITSVPQRTDAPSQSPPPQSVPQLVPSPAPQPEESRTHAHVKAPPIRVVQEASISIPAPSADVPPAPPTEAETPTGVQTGSEQQTGATVATAAAAAKAPSEPSEHPSRSTSASINMPQTPTGNTPSFAKNTPLATSPQASTAAPAQLAQSPSRPSASHPSFMRLAIENDQKVQQLPPEEEDHEELNSTLGSALGGTPQGNQGLASLENTGSTVVMPSLLSAVQEVGEPERSSTPPAATAAAPQTASSRASSQSSKPAAKEESEQGKENEQGKPPAAAATAARESKPQEGSAAAAAAAAAAKEENGPGKESKAKENGADQESKPVPTATGQTPAGNEQKKPGVKAEAKKAAEDSHEFGDIPEEAVDFEPDA